MRGRGASRCQEKEEPKEGAWTESFSGGPPKIGSSNKKTLDGGMESMVREHPGDTRKRR